MRQSRRFIVEGCSGHYKANAGVMLTLAIVKANSAETFAEEDHSLAFLETEGKVQCLLVAVRDNENVLEKQDG
jgi:hypothetical protein